MPPKTATAAKEASKDIPLIVVTGDDDHAASARAREIFKQWCDGGADPEVIDASSANSAEALTALGRLREGLLTLPFFGGSKAIWFRNCTFLGDDRTSNSSAVLETLGSLAEMLKKFDWRGVKLLISATEIDKRRSFYKTIEKLGKVERFEGLSVDSKGWQDQMELAAARLFKERNLQIDEQALVMLVSYVGPNSRALASEVEKLSLYCEGKGVVSLADVELLASRNKEARAFAVAEALGKRNLPLLMRTLDQELWSMQTDSSRNEIGLLYGILSKVRGMLLAKELVREGFVPPRADYNTMKAAVERIPAEKMPRDKKFNPAAMHPFVLSNALRDSENYTTEELVNAMATLLDCNLKLVSSSTDEASILQQALVKIARPRSAGEKMAR